MFCSVGTGVKAGADAERDFVTGIRSSWGMYS